MKRHLLIVALLNTILTASGNQCPSPENIDNGQYEYNEYSGWPGSICHVVYSCDVGFKLNGTGHLYCYHNKWIGLTPSCQAVTCPSLEAPAYGALKHIENAPHNQMDSIVEFSCNDEYELDGMVSLVCLPSGNWSAVAPSCASTKCHTSEKEYKSCQEIKADQPDSASGMYTIYGDNNEAYTTFCEMEADGGGWTLVASIHENDMSGKCTAGDRWSSENGVVQRNGETFWENEEIYGNAEDATIDDYKNKAYFELQATQLMLMQIPNGAKDYVSSVMFQYTTDSFLGQYGGNLAGLFASYPIKDGVLSNTGSDDGPAIPITFIKGTAEAAFGQYGSKTQQYAQKGFIQFRAADADKGASGFCLYGRVTNSAVAEHMCFGATIANGNDRSCGDFSGFDYGGGYSTSDEMRNSAFLILYR